MEIIESSDLEEGEILEHDISSISKEKDTFQFKGYVNVHLKRKLDLYDGKKCYRTIDNDNNNMLDSISSSEEDFSAEINHNNFKNDDGHFNFYTKRRSRLKGAQNRLLINGSAEDIMCQIDQTICRKNHTYKHKRRKELRYNWEKLYEKRNCSNRHRSPEMISSHKILGKKKVLKSKGSSDDSDSEDYFKNNLHKRKQSYYKKRKERDSDDYYCNGRNTAKKNCSANDKKPVNKILRDFDEVRRALLEKLKQQEMEMKKIPKIVEPTTNVDAQEANISMDSSNSEAEPSKDFNEVLPNENNEKNLEQNTHKSVCLEMDNEEDLDLVQLRLIALASNRKQKNLDNLNQPFQETEKTPPKLQCTSLFQGQTVNNVGQTKEEEEEEEEDEDTDLNRYELLLRAEALKTALLKKHQKRLIKLKTSKLNQSEDTNVSDVVSPNSEITSAESNPDQQYQGSVGQEMENNMCRNFNLKLENDTTTDNFDKENDMEVIIDSINPLKECEKDDNSDKFSQSTGESAKKKYQKTKNRKKKKKLSLSEDTKEKHKNLPLEEDCLTLRSQLLRDLIKKKTLKDTEKKSVLLDSAQISTNTNTSVEKNVEPFKEFISPPNATVKRIPKIPKPEIQRIIVHLGSEESSEDEEMSNDGQENTFLKTPNINGGVENNAITTELRASYERSVELLLSEARRKIEVELGKSKNNEAATPEAVYKHLPPSQRLEYIRLKQKIAEREKLRKAKKEISNGGISGNGRKEAKSELTTAEAKITVEKSTSENDIKANSQQQDSNLKNSPSNDVNLPSNFSTATMATPSMIPSRLFNSSPNLKIANSRIMTSPNKFLRANKSLTKERTSLVNGKSSVVLNSSPNFKEVIKKSVSCRNGSKSPITNQSNSIRTSHNQILLSKLKLLLKKIKIEKTIEENYEKEISKLKNQLSLFEKKKSEQRFKIKKLAEESVKTYKMIQNTAAAMKKTDSVEVRKNKLGSGSEIKKNDRITNSVKEEDGVEEVEKDNKKNEITEITKTDDENADETEKNVAEANGTFICERANELSQYNSPLEVFSKGSDNSKRLDPNVEMCQFDLTGICRDEDCTYQHLRPS